jgi:hypothetical protein
MCCQESVRGQHFEKSFDCACIPVVKAAKTDHDFPENSGYFMHVPARWLNHRRIITNRAGLGYVIVLNDIYAPK